MVIARPRQQVQAVEQASPGPTPIGDAFVASAIGVISAEKRVDAGQHPVNRSRPRLGFGLEQEVGSEHIGMDPRVPVVGWAVVGPGLDAEPCPVVHRPVRLQNPGVDFALDPVQNYGEFFG